MSIVYIGTAEPRGRANPTHVVRDTNASVWTARCSSAVRVVEAYPVPADVDVASQVGCKSCLRSIRSGSSVAAYGV